MPNPKNNQSKFIKNLLLICVSTTVLSGPALEAFAMRTIFALPKIATRAKPSSGTALKETRKKLAAEAKEVGMQEQDAKERVAKKALSDILPDAPLEERKGIILELDKLDETAEMKLQIVKIIRDKGWLYKKGDCSKILDQIETGAIVLKKEELVVEIEDKSEVTIPVEVEAEPSVEIKKAIEIKIPVEEATVAGMSSEEVKEEPKGPPTPPPLPPASSSPPPPPPPPSSTASKKGDEKKEGAANRAFIEIFKGVLHGTRLGILKELNTLKGTPEMKLEIIKVIQKQKWEYKPGDCSKILKQIETGAIVLKKEELVVEKVEADPLDAYKSVFDANNKYKILYYSTDGSIKEEDVTNQVKEAAVDFERRGKRLVKGKSLAELQDGEKKTLYTELAIKVDSIIDSDINKSSLIETKKVKTAKGTIDVKDYLKYYEEKIGGEEYKQYFLPYQVNYIKKGHGYKNANEKKDKIISAKMALLDRATLGQEEYDKQYDAILDEYKEDTGYSVPEGLNKAMISFEQYEPKIIAEAKVRAAIGSLRKKEKENLGDNRFKIEKPDGTIEYIKHDVLFECSLTKENSKIDLTPEVIPLTQLMKAPNLEKLPESEALKEIARLRAKIDELYKNQGEAGDGALLAALIAERDNAVNKYKELKFKYDNLEAEKQAWVNHKPQRRAFMDLESDDKSGYGTEEEDEENYDNEYDHEEGNFKNYYNPEVVQGNAVPFLPINNFHGNEAEDEEEEVFIEAELEDEDENLAYNNFLVEEDEENFNDNNPIVVQGNGLPFPNAFHMDENEAEDDENLANNDFIVEEDQEDEENEQELPVAYNQAIGEGGILPLLEQEILIEKALSEKAHDIIESTTESLSVMSSATINMASAVSDVINNRMFEMVTPLKALAAGDEESSIKKGLWISGLYGVNKQGAVDNFAGYKGRSAGVTIGFDVELDDKLLGVAYSNIQSNFKYNKSQGKANVNGHILTIYGQKDLSKDFSLQAILSGSRNAVKNKIIASGVPVTGKYKNTSVNFETLLNYKYQINGATLIPNIGIRYGHSHDGVYNESNVGTQHLSVGKKSQNLWTGIIGSRVIFAPQTIYNAINITPAIHGSIENHFNNKRKNINAKVEWSDKTIQENIVLPKQPKIGYNIGASILAEKNNVKLLVEYNCHLQKKYQSHQGFVKLKINF